MPVNPSPMLFLNKEVQFDDEVFHEIKDYFEEAERGEPIQVGDPPQYVLSSHAQLGASSSGGANPSTSGAPPANAGPYYACDDWSPGSLPRSWGSYGTSIGWDIYLARPPKMRDRIFPLPNIWPLVR